MGFDRQDEQEEQIPGKNLILGIEVRAELLGDTKSDATHERAPERANATNDDRLKSEQEVDATRRRSELRHCPVRNTRERDGRERERGRDTKDMAIIRAAQLRRLAVIGDRTDEATSARL